MACGRNIFIISQNAAFKSIEELRISGAFRCPLPHRESHAVRRLCDEVGNGPRLRHVDGVTGLDLDDSRTSAF
jgi:hypothetical protein